MLNDLVMMKIPSGRRWYTEKVSCLTPYGELEYQPIPLTEEILNANGAYDGDDGRSITIDCHYVGAKDVVSLCEYKGGFEISVLTCVDMTGEPNEVYDLPPVKYVHELQHALRLCGLNELADNFKIE